MLRAASLVGLCAALAVLFIWSRTRALASSYELGELQKAHARLVSDNDRLRIEVETLRSPAALERFARTRLGMAPPAPGAVLAAGPRLAAGRAGVDGVGHRPTPAEPLSGRAAAGARVASSDAPRVAEVPGEPVALRGPSRAAPAPRGE
ncbi:MAG TPA: cell division protein FtsL [Anaeromyxobacteraceae bacterium]|nr:cell division protein FtsL [Anaeromyxobacteraceae bacterium]